MASVLIVEDTPFDLMRARTALRREDGLVISTAGDGNEALLSLADGQPDLVVTDLQMPNMGGLELLKQIRKGYPAIPVIVCTSHGSEETAMEAIALGAVQYIPKSQLESQLCPTIRSVLSVSRKKQKRDVLLQCVDREFTTMRLGNDCEVIPDVVALVQEKLQAMELCDTSNQTVRLGVAMEEALVNAMVHGNLGVGSELRGVDDKKNAEIIAERRQASPWAERVVTLELNLNREEGRIVVRDQGAGFDVSALPSPKDPEALLRPSGRGVLLMRNFADEVVYNEVGNEVTMIFRAPGGTPAAPQLPAMAAALLS